MELMKEDAFSEWYHRVLAEGEVIDDRYSIKGMSVYRKWGLSIIRDAQRFLEGLLEEDGHEPVYFPVLIPEDVLGKESEHIAGFEEQVFWVTHAGKNLLDRRMALRPTSETCMYDMMSLWIRSHTDLPVKIHQSVAVYRYETKHTRPLIRGREFLWNEGHTAFATENETEENIETIKKIYGRLINELLCLPYQVNKRPDWDKFPGAKYTIAFETLMPDGRTLQVATAHNLGQNFSKVFNIEYEKDDGSREYVHQSSYGPGFGRLLAATISVHGDEKGMVLPPKIAPLQAVVIPILIKGADKDKILYYAAKVEDKLKSLGVRVKTDDSDEHPGAKHFRWELRGVPVRIEVGPRDVKASQVVVARRDTGDKKALKTSELKKILEVFDEIEDNLRRLAQKEFDSRQYTAESTVELDENLMKGIVTVGWCGSSECAPEIESRATILTVTEDIGDCIVCGKKGKKIRVAKTY